MQWVSVFLIIFISFFANAEDCGQLIGDNPSFGFARSLLQSDLSNEAKIQAINTSCREIDLSTTEGTFAQRTAPLANTFQKVMSPFSQMFGMTSIAFSRLGDSQVEQEFKRELEQIRQNQNPDQRIRATYELVSRYQGRYRYDENGRPSGNSPFAGAGKMLRVARDEGEMGVCRDFARLLYWSLMQVSRPAGEVTAFNGIADNSFTMDLMQGSGQYNGKSATHVWIRINRPRQTENGREWDRFDLDTTFYNDRYTPLMSRHQGWSESDLKRLHGLCQRVATCLRDQESPTQDDVITILPGDDPSPQSSGTVQ